MKRTLVPITLLIVVAALSLLWGGFSLAQGQPLIHVVPADQHVDVGQEAAVQVWVDSIEGFYAAQFDISFDPSVLEGLSVEPGTAFTDHPGEYEVALSQITGGTVRFAATLLRTFKADPITGNAHIATIRFRGLADGISPLSWGSIKLSNLVSQAIVPVSEDGQIVVGDVTPTVTVTPTTTVTPTVTPTTTVEPTVTPGPGELGTLLKGVAVDAGRNRIYVSAHSNDSVAIVDGSTYQWIESVPSGGIDPNGLALTDDGSKLFVVNSGSNQVAVLDPGNGFAVLATIGVEGAPFGVAISNGIAYVTNFDSDSVTLIDVNGLYAIRTLAVGRHPSLPAATGDHAYIPIHSAYDRWQAKNAEDEWSYVTSRRGNDTGVAVVYADGRLDRVLTDYIGFFAAAVDEVHGLVYITKRDGTAEGLYVLDANDHSLIRFVSMLRPYAVAVNPATNHVFVVQADMDEVYVLDAADDYRLVRVVNTDPNNGDFPGMHGGQGIGIHGTDVIVTSFISGTLTVFDEANAGANLPIGIAPEIIRGWQETGGSQSPLGAATDAGASYMYAEQHFERGVMNWRQSTSGNSVFVLDIESPLSGGTDWNGREDGVWARYDDLWNPSLPVLPAACPDAAWPYGPMFGFGLTWCQEPGVKTTIGYPIGESLVDYGGDQSFANGAVFWNPATDSYIALYNAGQRWQYYRAHRRYPIEVGDPNVTGQITLQGRTDHRGIVLEIEHGPYLATGADGQFAFGASGEVTVRFSYPGYLDAQATVKATQNQVVHLGDTFLLGGDVNGDNRIDILDISFVGYRFGSTDAGADLTGDGEVDILDLSLVGANFGKTGPTPW